MKAVTIKELRRRLEATLSKDRSSLSIGDVELIEKAIRALEELKKLKTSSDKQRKIEEITYYLFSFFGNHQILKKYQKELEQIFHHLT